MKMKKLNRKGFTLIELLAVIVILAVVMGVAATSVLSAMNNSRRSSLQNSAQSAADAFRTKYAEYSMSPNGELLGIKDGNTAATKYLTNLLNGTAQKLSVVENPGDVLNLATTNYDLANSYVYFNKTTSSFTVCLVAKNTGSYFVAAAVGKNKAAMGSSPALTTTQMWACSDNTHSWND